jgi:hypothetical protein
MKSAATRQISAETGSIGFKAVNNIFDKWGVDLSQRLAMLRLARSTYYKYCQNPGSIKLDSDQLTRISYILNIYSALKIIFNNRDNVNGFVKMPNHNPFFNGRTPLEVMSTGAMSDMYETFRRIDGMRGAGW